MPNRPPKDWFDRCVEDVAVSGHAASPAAVCGATWARKTAAERRTTLGMEEPMTHTKKHGHAKKKHGKHPARKHSKPRAVHHSKAARTAARRGVHHAKKKAHHKCVMCGHGDRHDQKAGCTHFDGKNFCPCRHRG
jgi:hypothetical protein